MNWRKRNQLEMKAERSNRINIAWDKERKRTEQPIVAQLTGTLRSPKSALAVAHAKFEAVWAPNLSHGEATICAGSKWPKTMGSEE